MDELYGTADKLFRDIEHLRRILDDNEGTYDNDLALTTAKRVRRHCNILVRALANERDKTLQPGGTSE